MYYILIYYLRFIIVLQWILYFLIFSLKIIIYCFKGDGTRKGNGLCKCHTGYEGENCDRCASNYFAVLKNDTLSCEQCHKSCKEGCTDSQPRGSIYLISQ